MTEYPLPNNACDPTGQAAPVTGTTSGLGWGFADAISQFLEETRVVLAD